MIETVLLGLLDRWGWCGGELLIIGLNRPQNFWVYLLFNGLGCSPDGIFDRNRRTRSMSNDTDAIYAEQRHTTVLLIIGLFPNRLECTFGEPCAELSSRIPEELEFEPGQYRVGDCFSGLEDHVAGEPVADHHFSRLFKQVVSFDVTAKIESARFQQFESFFGHVVTPQVFFANGHQRD